VTPVLAAGAVLLAFAAAWELAGSLAAGGRRTGAVLSALSGGRVRSLAAAAFRLELPQRLERAGLGDRVEPTAVIAAKLLACTVGGAVGMVAAPVAPGRLAPVLVAVLALAGFLVPDALLERAARLRRARFVAALPDALDMLAVGAASGRGAASALGEVAATATGTLASELGGAVAEIECGTPPREALEALRRRIPGAEVGALAAAVERSRVYGSPLADQLHEQATSLRRDARRRIEDSAARAAPKIQLVVALILVPSVLLMIVAAVIAHSDALFGAF
jgi:tight adherence protein C